ncbi:hypothetical protein MTO96_038420 [Rhipicephalus appendiculatus]
MSAGRTWKILRHMLDPNSTTTATRVQMAKLRHKYKDYPEGLRGGDRADAPRSPGRPESPRIPRGSQRGTRRRFFRTGNKSGPPAAKDQVGARS